MLYLDLMRRLPPMRRSKAVNMTEMLLNCQPDTVHLTDPLTHHKPEEILVAENQRMGTETPTTTTTTITTSQKGICFSRNQ